jgi:dihydroneopterin aldolase
LNEGSHNAHIYKKLRIDSSTGPILAKLKKIGLFPIFNIDMLSGFIFGIVMDTLQIKNLTVNTRIGIYDWEQQILQRLSIDIAIPIDCNSCNENFNSTVDYEKLCTRVTQHVEAASFRLLESAATNIAELIKKEFNISQFTLSVSKPHAIKNAGDIRITIMR